MSTPALIRVLHVDDEESQREFAKMFLEEDGVIQVTSAASGKEVLQLLEKESYDCIVSDYQMNGMTGIQLAEKIKSQLRYRLYSTPVVEARKWLRPRSRSASTIILEKRLSQLTTKY